MKNLDWNLIISLLIAMAIFKLIDKLFLDTAISKIGESFEVISK